MGGREDWRDPTVIILGLRIATSVILSDRLVRGI